MIVPKENPIDDNGDFMILAYFTISTKTIKIPNTLSKSKIKTLDGLNKNAEEISSFLIGQLAKNDNYNSFISGKDVLDYALNVIQKCHELLGMRVILIECENRPKLIKFYEDNYFQLIGQDEKTKLMQLVTTISQYKATSVYIKEIEKVD